MDETILFPSPNWFQPSGLAVSSDDWLVYGGPSKSLCVLQPLPQEYMIRERLGYTAHVVNRAHPEKIVCVDISPEWPEKKLILSGSSDGTVKQWNIEEEDKSLSIKLSNSHEIHSHEKEEVAGVGYCKDGYAVTVGSFGVIVKWDLNSNVAKSFNHVLKSFKPVCMACSPHTHMNVAIGTKQGVVFVLDLNGTPRIIYKVRGQDDEILKVSWCPQYEVAVRKALKESDRKSTATTRMEKSKETESPNSMKHLDERVKNSETIDKPVKINEKGETIEEKKENLDESGIGKTLPEDSFEDSIQEDDMFDIYQEPEINEFGHKKFQPLDIIVKVPDESKQEDYLVECQKLKHEILKRKSQAETSIEALVNAMENTELDKTDNETQKVEGETQKTKVETQKTEGETHKIESETDKVENREPGVSKPASPTEGKITKGEVESSVHIHKHLLATIGKYGSVRIWSKSGKLVGSCAVANHQPRANRNQRPPLAATLLWYQPNELFIADGKSQVLVVDPLNIDCKNKLEYRVLHSYHKRGLYALASGAPRTVAPGAAPTIAPLWSAAQDRSLVGYWPNGTVDHHATCGGYIYDVQWCPGDATRVAISVGDGAVRVWECEEADRNERLGAGITKTYWQNVQGKVLTVAWHPSKEGLLAFGTAESRVGLIDTCGKTDKPAKVLQSYINGGVYSISWGLENELFVSAAGELYVYNTDNTDLAPTKLEITLEGQKWEVTAVRWYDDGLVVGSNSGAVAVTIPQQPYTVTAAEFPFNKMIHTMAWQESTSDGSKSLHTTLIAVCSLDRSNTVAILQYTDKEEGGGKQLKVWKTLAGHTGSVLQVSWSPHDERQLLSTSHDGTVRVWDIVPGTCTSIFAMQGAALSAAWSPWTPGHVLSGGGDCALRFWKVDQHPAEAYAEIKHETSVEKKKRKNKKEKKADEESPETVTVVDPKAKTCSKKFLLPMTHKQTQPCLISGGRIMLQRYLQRTRDMQVTAATELQGVEYLKLFGNINQLNELLDMEMERHEDTGNFDSWSMLGVVRGDMETVLRRAANTDNLDTFLLSLAPYVSFKYWKDATLLYLQQIDRLIAKGEDSKLYERRTYGGTVYRKMVVQLSLHDIKAAVATLHDSHLYKEAYVLSRTRYMDGLAEQSLRLWAQESLFCGHFNLAAVCYIALNDLPQAAAALGKSSDEESLCLAADIAKVLGQNTFAGHIEEKREMIKNKKESLKVHEDLKELPTRAQLEIGEQTDKGASNEELIEKQTKELQEKEGNNNLKPEIEKDITEIDRQKLTQLAENEKVTQNSELTENKPEQVPLQKLTENDENLTENTQLKQNVEELVQKLPEKMEKLMKEAHKGDGDTIRNGSGLEITTKMVGNGEAKENVNVD